MNNILIIVIIVLISIIFILKYQKLKYIIICICLVTSLAVTLVPILQQNRIKKTIRALCEMNEMTLENQNKGNSTATYSVEDKQLLFTDNVLVGDNCFAFDVVTYMNVLDENISLIDYHDMKTLVSPTYESTVLKSNWGELFITNHHIQSKVEDPFIILNGSAIIESQSGNKREIYNLQIYYEYNIKDNLISNRLVEIQKE